TEPAAAAVAATVVTAVVVVAAIVVVVAASVVGGNFATNPAGAIDGFFARDADADSAGGLARNRAGLVAGVLDRAALGDPLVAAKLDLLLTHFGLADGDLALDLLGVADLLANRDRAFTILWAAHPDLLRARRLAAIVVARVATGVAAAAVVVVAMATEEAAAAEEAAAVAHFTAFPVAGADELLLHASFLHVLVAGLVDAAIFPASDLVADVAALFTPDRDFLHALNDLLLAHRNANSLTGVVTFGTT